MKMRILAVGLFLSVCLPSMAEAQNKIVILKKDGTREEVDINQPTKSPDLQKSEAIIDKPIFTGITAADLLKEEPVLDIPQITQQASPVSNEKNVPIVKPAKKAKQQQKFKATKPIPSTPLPKPKPNEEGIVRAKVAKPLFDYIDPKNIPAGTVITRDLAVRAALEVAPPARSFDVFEMEYKSRPAYQVRFNTENGPHDIIIDAETGKALKK